MEILIYDITHLNSLSLYSLLQGSQCKQNFTCKTCEKQFLKIEYAENFVKMHFCDADLLAQAMDQWDILSHASAVCLTNSLAPGKSVSNFKIIIIKLIIQNV